MQRDAVNTEIVYALQDEKKQYHKHLQIINALAERAQEMTAVEYLTIRRKIDEAYCQQMDYEICKLCPLGKVSENGTRFCSYVEVTKNPQRTVAILKKWKEEHHD